jgi:hypothetical protein
MLLLRFWFATALQCFAGCYRYIWGATINQAAKMTTYKLTKRPRFLSAMSTTSLIVSLMCLASLLLATSLHYHVSLVMGLSLLWVPIGVVLGLYVLLRVAIIIGREPAVEERKRLKRTALIGAGGALGSIALVVCLSLTPLVDYMSSRDAIVNDFNNMAALAYEYRNRPLSGGGGNGSFVGWQIPKRMETWSTKDPEEGTFSYRIVSVGRDSIVLEGRYQNEKTGAVRVKVDANCRLTNWQFFGDMDY